MESVSADGELGFGLVLVVAVDCCVAACCVLVPQPRQKRKKEKLAPVAIVFNNLPKLHPKKNQTCQHKRGI
jgi:hypothetical protein